MSDYRLIGNRLVPLTEEDINQRKIDEENFMKQKSIAQEEENLKAKKLAVLKEKLSITDEDLEIIRNGRSYT